MMTLSATFGRMWGFLDDLHLRRRAVQRILRELARIRSVRSSFLRALASPARLRGTRRVSVSFDACEEVKGELVSLRSEGANVRGFHERGKREGSNLRGGDSIPVKYWRSEPPNCTATPCVRSRLPQLHHVALGRGRRSSASKIG